MDEYIFAMTLYSLEFLAHFHNFSQLDSMHCMYRCILALSRTILSVLVLKLTARPKTTHRKFVYNFLLPSRFLLTVEDTLEMVKLFVCYVLNWYG